MPLHSFAGGQDPQISKLGNTPNLLSVVRKILGLLLFLLVLLQQAGVIPLISKELPLLARLSKKKAAGFFLHDRTISYSRVSDKGNKDLGAELFINLVCYFEDEIVNLQALSPGTVTHDVNC